MTHDARDMREPCRKFAQQFVRGPLCPLQKLSTHVATVVLGERTPKRSEFSSNGVLDVCSCRLCSMRLPHLRSFWLASLVGGGSIRSNCGRVPGAVVLSRRFARTDHGGPARSWAAHRGLAYRLPRKACPSRVEAPRSMVANAISKADAAGALDGGGAREHNAGHHRAGPRGRMPRSMRSDRLKRWSHPLVWLGRLSVVLRRW